jgi:hypothetical protein
MSLEVIEILIKESLRDGVISIAEKESLIHQAEQFGISVSVVESLITEQLDIVNRQNIQAELKVEQEKQKSDRIKKETFVMTFEKLIRKWCQRQKDCKLNNEDKTDLRREAVNSKIDIDWLENWIKTIEEEEQKIAGIKPSFGARLKNMFGK